MQTDKKTLTGYKGFNPDWTCRNFQFKVGESYTHQGEASLCNSGFHFCENPIDVFGYYPPTGKFAVVEAEGVDEKTDSDSKRSAKTLHIKAELSLHALIGIGVKFILSKVDFKNAPATNTGYSSAATNTGDRSAATNTGDRSAATNTGYSSAASVDGKESIAIVTGKDSKASGALGCWIVLTERNDDWKIVEVKSFKVDGKKIKPGVFYKLTKGKAVAE